MEDTVTIYLRVNEERTKRNLLEHQENYNNKMRKLHGTKAGAYTLKGQQLNTAKEFIRLWSIQCRANSIYNLSPNRHFWVTTSLIAKRAGVSYTTVQRHVSRLLEAKVITQKTFHGTNCAPRYQLNPDILTPIVAPEDQAKLPQNFDLTTLRFSAGCSAIYSVCSDTASSSVLEALKKKNEREVTGNLATKDSSAFARAARQISGASVAARCSDGGNIAALRGAHPQSAIETLKSEVHDAQEAKGQIGSLKEYREQRKQNKSAGTGVAAARREKLLQHFIAMAFTYMIRLLYTGRNITDRQQQESFHFMRQYFDQAQDLGEYYQDFIEQIMLKRKSLETNPESFILPPNTWLNPVNRWGYLSAVEAFQKVKELRKNKKYYYSRRKVLVKCIKECMLNYTDDSIRKSERDISKLKNPDKALAFFRNAIADPNQYAENLKKLARPFYKT